MVCIKTCYSFKPVKTLSMTQKHKSLRSWYFEITLIDVLGHVDQNYLFFGNTFWAIILSLDRNDTNNLGPKGHPFKTILIWEGRLQVGGPCMACIIAQSRQIVRMKKRKKNNKRKIDCHVMHLKNSIKSKQE